MSRRYHDMVEVFRNLRTRVAEIIPSERSSLNEVCVCVCVCVCVSVLKAQIVL